MIRDNANFTLFLIKLLNNTQFIFLEIKKSLKILRLMKIKYWDVNIIRNINSIKWLPLNFSKIMFLNVLQKHKYQLIYEIFVVLFTVSIIKKKKLISSLSKKISKWEILGGTPYKLYSLWTIIIIVWLLDCSSYGNILLS